MEAGCQERGGLFLPTISHQHHILQSVWKHSKLAPAAPLPLCSDPKLLWSLSHSTYSKTPHTDPTPAATPQPGPGPLLPSPCVPNPAFILYSLTPHLPMSLI